MPDVNYRITPPSFGGANPTSPASSPIQGPSASSFGTVGPTPTGAQQNALQQNLAGAPDLTSLTNLVNQLNLNAQQQANAGRVPGSTAIENQLSANTSQLAQGQLPQDVINQIGQQAAERGVSTGNNNFLQALGLNSLQAQQMAQQNLSAADARNPVAPIFDPTSMLLTPYQSGELGVQNARLGLDWYRALNQPRGGSGGGSQQQQGYQAPPSTPNWFNSLMGGTPSPGAPPPSIYTGGQNTSLYPGTSVPGLPDLGSILGQQDPGYGFSPDPYGQPSYGGDASNPSYWDFTNPAMTQGDTSQFTGDTSGYTDPFNLYQFYGG